MSGNETVADANKYWRRYYAERFRFGLGTEDILAALMTIPPIPTWVDLGCGSESMLWAIALRAQQLVAVDVDRTRLKILGRFAELARPRGVHTTALALCGRAEPDDFLARCRSLVARVCADCLNGSLPADLTATAFDLVTQFGLLGLCRNDEHFTTRFAEIHRLLAPGGWTAGANWVARDRSGRVQLNRRLYQHAATQAGVHLLFLKRITTADPEFPAVWTYVGRTMPCPPAEPLSHQTEGR
ncbi:methyltransferase domain-containing protein [Actinoalloteichus hymeniacidonis]|uniref:Methyltransferase domain n=1 Tax=Actinoalloteichus hymeniacidonis TaxID=340345 RepID=A0AAC9HX29_9PSEU|nr:class I SAM-dependent methyltransferase [Actinoalloteichus hymeniacidonis]AOS66065.1 Methyltransferase domain [Actinoalloteichus hymeniacidonis]MBB5905832.1 SAM-dependent methyltransferase [Actinoalloteichus hymeniacidonis]